MFHPADMEFQKIDARQDAIGFLTWATKVSRAARPRDLATLRKLLLRCQNCTNNSN